MHQNFALSLISSLSVVLYFLPIFLAYLEKQIYFNIVLRYIKHPFISKLYSKCLLQLSTEKD